MANIKHSIYNIFILEYSFTEKLELGSRGSSIYV